MELNDMFPAELRTVQITNPEFVLPGIIDYEGVPYKVISQDGEIYTCQELTGEEFASLANEFRRIQQRKQEG